MVLQSSRYPLLLVSNDLPTVDYRPVDVEPSPRAVLEKSDGID